MADFTAQTSISDSIGGIRAGKIASLAPAWVAHGLFTARQVVTYTPTPANATVFTVVLNGTSFSYTSDADGTAAEIVTGLSAAINAGAVPVTASGSATLILTADAWATEFSYSSTGAGVLTAALTSSFSGTLADGVFVLLDETQATDPQNLRLPASAADITNGLLGLGVTLAQNYTQVRLGNYTTTPHMVPVLRKGIVTVKVEQAVAPGDAVYVRYAAGGNGQGSFGNTAGTSERALLAGAVYRRAASANGVAEVELNLKA